MPLLSFTVQQGVYASLRQECYKFPHMDKELINELHTEDRNFETKTIKTIFAVSPCILIH